MNLYNVGMEKLEKYRLSLMRNIREVKVSHNQNSAEKIVRDELLEEGIDWSIVNLPIGVIEFQSLNRKYRGIGIENSKKGYEFYNRSLMQYPVSVGEKGLTIVSGGKSNDIAIIFHDSLDYMAWCSYMAAQKKNTDNADCYIMGDFSTFTELGKITKKYKKILCYFHNDQCGEVMYNTLREMTNGSSVVDMSSLYDGFECIRFYWKDLLTRQ